MTASKPMAPSWIAWVTAAATVSLVAISSRRRTWMNSRLPREPCAPPGDGAGAGSRPGGPSPVAPPADPGRPAWSRSDSAAGCRRTRPGRRREDGGRLRAFAQDHHLLDEARHKDGLEAIGGRDRVVVAAVANRAVDDTRGRPGRLRWSRAGRPSQSRRRTAAGPCTGNGSSGAPRSHPALRQSPPGHDLAGGTAARKSRVSAPSGLLAAHMVLHHRVAASVAMLVAQPLEDALGAVLLLGRTVLVRLQDRVDHRDQRAELRLLRRPATYIAGGAK